MRTILPCVAVLVLVACAPYPGSRAGAPEGQPVRLGDEMEWSPAQFDALRSYNAEQELSAVLDDFHDAASKSDFQRYFSHWTSVSVFLGTDATERWVGQEFRDFAGPYFEKGKGWTYRAHDRHITIGSDEDRAFFDELLDNDKLGLCRGSGCAKKIKGEWKILQYNLSIPVPNDKAERVAAVIRAEAPPAPPVDGKHKE